MRVRLLYVIGNLDVGGAERHLLQILPRLKACGFEPMVYTLSWQGVLAPAFTAAGIAVYSPPFAVRLRAWPRLVGRPLLLLVSGARLLALLLSLRPRIVHFFLPEAYLVGALVSLCIPGLKRVMSRRSLDIYQAKHPLLARVERRLHPHMDAILGNAHAIIGELSAEGVDPRRLGIIYNGIERTSFEKAKPRSEVRKALGVSDCAFVLIMVANLIPYKGYEDLITALGCVSKEMPSDWVLLCVGADTGIRDGLAAKAERAAIGENVRWMGLRDDVPDLLMASDVGILCSHQEGFSNSILEGMAAGLPMVVTDVGGNKEAVVDGETGLVVPPHEPITLGRAVVTLGANRQAREKMGAAGRLRLIERFSLSSCVRQYCNLYNGMLDRSPQTVQDLIDGED